MPTERRGKARHQGAQAGLQSAQCQPGSWGEPYKAQIRCSLRRRRVRARTSTDRSGSIEPRHVRRRCQTPSAVQQLGVEVVRRPSADRTVPHALSREGWHRGGHRHPHSRHPALSKTRSSAAGFPCRGGLARERPATYRRRGRPLEAENRRRTLRRDDGVAAALRYGAPSLIGRTLLLALVMRPSINFLGKEVALGTDLSSQFRRDQADAIALLV